MASTKFDATCHDNQNELDGPHRRRIALLLLDHNLVALSWSHAKGDSFVINKRGTRPSEGENGIYMS